MKIAIPMAEGQLAIHFGHCQSFALLDVDVNTKKIIQRQDIPAPPHQPGLLPPWLAQRGVNLVIAGGMGARAIDLMVQQGVQVVLGAVPDVPEKVVMDHLMGVLQTGANPCDH
jgi:predicted Fe-Mo cluster-binding NifX family protein